MLYEGMLTMNTKITFPDFRRETPRMEVDQGFISMNQVFMLLYLLQNSKQQKNLRLGLSKVLPSIRKYGQYKLFDNSDNNMFKIENETDLHYKVVQYISRFYPEAIIVAGRGENQDTSQKRINSWKKGK